MTKDFIMNNEEQRNLCIQREKEVREQFQTEYYQVEMSLEQAIEAIKFKVAEDKRVAPKM